MTGNWVDVFGKAEERSARRMLRQAARKMPLHGRSDRKAKIIFSACRKRVHSSKPNFGPRQNSLAAD